MKFFWNVLFIALIVSPEIVFAYYQPDDLSIDASKKRMSLVGQLVVAGEDKSTNSSSTPSNSTLEPGQQVVKKFCSVCHTSGIAGAPKIGDQHAWMDRYEQGWETIMQRATQGYRGMPAKGHCVKCSDKDLRDAIEYMMRHSQIDLK